MTPIACARCGNSGQQMAAPPLPGDLGNRIYDTICQSCWDQWLQQQTVIINHYGLDLRLPESRQILTQQTEAFLFGPPPE